GLQKRPSSVPCPTRSNPLPTIKWPVAVNGVKTENPPGVNNQSLFGGSGIDKLVTVIVPQLDVGVVHLALPTMTEAKPDVPMPTGTRTETGSVPVPNAPGGKNGNGKDKNTENPSPENIAKVSSPCRTKTPSVIVSASACATPVRIITIASTRTVVIFRMARLCAMRWCAD